MDINPNTEGMTLIIPKNHYSSYLYDLPENVRNEVFSAGETVAKKITNFYGDSRVAVVAEGMGVDHFHLKIYPMHGVKKDFAVIEAQEKIFFDKYPGYISTKMGNRADLENLNTLAEKIRLS